MTKNQQLRKKYHRHLVERSKVEGHPRVGPPGSTMNYLHKLHSK